MIILKNPGEIELDLIKTMGVNIKENDNAIGHFGTGLKYAIAVFLREGRELKIYKGKHEYQFATESKTIRGKEFQICRMYGPYGGEDLAFTTELGKNWDLWQAYRELESNCRDEGGSIISTPSIGDGTTVIMVDMTRDETQGVFLDKSRKLLLRNKNIEIYEGNTDWIYYRGIRAKKLPRISTYTYNILKECSLTEDRLLTYTFEVDETINDAIAEMKNKHVIKEVITAPVDRYESTLCQEHYTNVPPKDEFLEMAKVHRGRLNRSVKDYIVKHEPAKPPSAQELKERFIHELDDFCKAHGVRHSIDVDGYVTIIACELLGAK